MGTKALQRRAATHAALGDAVRLAIVDELARSDRSPIELRRMLGIESNLLAHHLDVLEGVGLIVRSRSSGDGRRRYVRLLRGPLDGLAQGPSLPARRALFVCTRNSARSQLAAALWTSIGGGPAESAGTQPAPQVHPGALAAAERVGLDLHGATPRALAEVKRLPSIVVTVCDQAHEDLPPDNSWYHWSIPDPVSRRSPGAFDATVAELRRRISAVLS